MADIGQTNKQTNKSKLSTWWLTTTFSEDEINRLEDTTTYPAHVLKVHGGRELCPETNKIHFQGAIQLRPGVQQRMSYFKTWLPTTHFEPANSAEAVRKYAMKSETAAGVKIERENTIKYYSADEICVKIGSLVTDEDIMETADHKVWFKRAVTRLLRQDIKVTAQVMNPSLKSFWCDYANVFIDKSRCPEDERSESEEVP